MMSPSAMAASYLLVLDEYRKQFGTIGGAWKQCVGLQPEK